jgi:hypothetical protein
MPGGPKQQLGRHLNRNAASARRLGRRERRHAGGEIVEPGDQLGMIAAPTAAEAEVAIAERAGERDLADSIRE